MVDKASMSADNQPPTSRDMTRYVAAVAAVALVVAACGERKAAMSDRAAVATSVAVRVTPQPDAAVHAPPGYARIGDVIHLVFRPACAETECTKGTGELHSQTLNNAPVVTPMTFDPNEGFSADVTITHRLHYWAQFAFASTTARWPTGTGSWPLEVIDGRPTDVDVSTAVAAPLTSPAMELSFGTGASSSDIGLIVGDQSAGMGPTAITAIAVGGIVVPDPVNSRLVIVDRAKTGTVSIVRLDHRPEFAAALAVGYVTVTSDSKVRFVDATGKLAVTVETPGVLGAPIGFTTDERGTWLAGSTDARRSRLSPASGHRSEQCSNRTQ